MRRGKPLYLVAALGILAAAVLATYAVWGRLDAGAYPAVGPTATNSPSSTPTATVTPSPTSTATSTRTPSTTATSTRTSIPAATSTHTSAPTSSLTQAPTQTSPTVTPPPTEPPATPTFSPTPPPPTPVPAPVTGRRPNILVITIDTLRYDVLGVNGNPTVKTPNLDALARSGANFTMAMSTFSQTDPAHASMFTGTYPSTHKAKIHCSDPVSQSVDLLAEVLKRNRLSTNAIYSWPCFEWDTGFKRGFDLFRGVYFEVASGKDLDHGIDGRADVTTNAVLDWARQKPASPYFLWVHYMDPHYAYTPPPPFDTMYDPDCKDCLSGNWDTIDMINAALKQSGSVKLRDADINHIKAGYEGEVSFTDQELGRLLAGLKSSGDLDNTLIVVVADHGESFNDNGHWFHPLILFNSVVRVPLIVVYPPVIPAGTVVNGVVSVVDIMPTILETWNISPPAATEGKSLWPLIQGTEKPGGRTAYVETVEDRFIAMIKGQWKLIRNLMDGSSVLYDLNTDPGENINVAAANSQQVGTMGAELDRYLVSHGIR